MSDIAETLRIEIPIEVLDKTDPGLASIIKELGNLDKSAKTAEKSVSKFDKGNEKTQNRLNQMTKGKYQLILNALDKVSPILKLLGTGLKNVTSKAWKVTMKAVDLVTSPVRGILNILKNPLFQVGAVLGVSIGVKDTIDTFANFEASMSNVKAISGANASQMTQLTAKAKEMGESTSKTAKDAGDALGYMALAGWDTDTMLTSLKPTLRLSEAGNMDLARTSDLVTDSMSSLSIEAEELETYLDKMAKTAASSNTNIDALMEAFVGSGGTISNLKMPLSEASALLGVMANRGTKGSEASHAFNSVLINLTTGAGKAGEAMEKLGLSAFDSEGSFKGYANVLKELNQKLQGMNDEQKSYYLNAIGGKVRISDLQKMLAGVGDEYDELHEKIENSRGALNRMAETMQDNVKGSFTKLQSAAEGAKIALGERLAPYLRQFADWCTSQMPNIKVAISSAMDFIEEKIANLKATIQEFTNSDDWADADFFGKIEIAWDKIIAEPFLEWWNSTGKKWFADVAGSIGQGIGIAISRGLLALLGIDIAQGIDEGYSIGAAFAAGFSEGFDNDAVKEAMGKAITGIFTSAAEVLPGGKPATASSYVSAGLVAYTGVKAGGMIAKGAGLANGILGTASTASGALAGTGIMGGLANVGAAAGSTAYTGAGLALSGAGTVAGGVVGGLVAIDGAMDLYKSYKSEDEREAEAYKKSGGKKVAGVIAGAAIGTAILPGVGTAIGAGIGGVVGWIEGDKEKKKYEDQILLEQELLDQAKMVEQKEAKRKQIELAKSKFKTQELKDALDDASMTVEEFEKKFNKAVVQNLNDHFGNIKLSIDEIQSIAQKITLGNNLDAMEEYSESTDLVAADVERLKNATKSMDKLNWKAGLGLKLDISDKDSYKAGIDELLKSANLYLESSHYKYTKSVGILLEPEQSVGIIASGDNLYESLQSQLDSINTELIAQVDIALEDNKVNADEQAIILDLQNKMKDITDKVTNAQNKAELEAIKIKFGTADIDAESFIELQNQLAIYKEKAAQSYDESLKLGISTIELQLTDGIISEEDYKAQLELIKQGYSAKIYDLKVSVESFQLDVIAEKYATELDGILPELSGTTAERLSAALRDAMANGIDPTTWDTVTAAKWLGLESLDLETQENIAKLMGEVAKSLPIPVIPLSSNIAKGALEDIQPLVEASNTLYDTFGTNLNSQFSTGYDISAPVAITASYTLTNPLQSIDFVGGSVTTTGFNQSIKKHANGGILTSPHLGLVAEDGAEAIIPLSGKRRGLGLSIWQQAGELLGVKPHANGGVFGRASTNSYSMIMDTLNSSPFKISMDMNSETEDINTFPAKSKEQLQSLSSIQIDVNVSPLFTISGGDTDDNHIVNVLRSHIRGMADDISDEIAQSLEKIFSNMPLKQNE